jgi:hypothetical protein
MTKHVDVFKMTSMVAHRDDKQHGTAVIDDTKRFRPGLSSIKDSSVNLLKNCVGAGVFSLSSRVNSVSIHPSTMIPASCLILLMAVWATYNFYTIGETCELTNSFSYPEAWGNTVSQRSQWIVTAAIVVAPIVSCLANTIVLTDILGIIMRNVGVPLAIYGNRNLVIAILASCILFPLCSLENLSALKSVSAFGLLGQMTAMATLGVRLYDKSYFKGGLYFNQEAATLASIAPTIVDPSKWFVLASLLSYCFVSHYNAPRYYSELREQTSRRFLSMASISYSLASIVYIITMGLGLKLFGSQAQSFVLNNFSPIDPLATIARVAFGFSVLASTPLIFLAMRNWFMAFFKKRAPNIAGRRQITMLLLSFISFLAVFFKDIALVGSLAGSILGSSVMFIFPPIMYMSAIYKNSMAKEEKLPYRKLALNLLLMVMGGTLALFGTYNTIAQALK